MSEINTSKLEYTGTTTPANTAKVQEAAYSGEHAGATARAPAVVLVDANLQDATGAPATGVDQPTGGAGLLGWLSGIYARAGQIATAIAGTLNIRSLSGATDSVSVSNLPSVQQVEGAVVVGNFPATQQVAGTVSVGNFPATQQVAGTVSVGNFPATQAVSGAVSVSNFPATQPVSGPLTDAQLRAAAVPVTVGNFPATQAVNLIQLGGVAIDATGIPSTEHQDFENAGRVFNAPINPTPLTGVVLTTATQTTYVNTAPNILIVAAAGKPVTVKEIQLKVTGAGTGLTSLQVLGIMDSVARYTSGGTTLTARNNAFTASSAVVRVGTVAIVASAPSATARTVFNPVVVTPALPAVNANYKLVFGEPGAINAGANGVISLPPVRIPAGGSLALHLIGPGMTAAPTFEGTIVIQE